MEVVLARAAAHVRTTSWLPIRRSRRSTRLRPGVHVSASTSDVISEAAMVMASARKKLPVTPVTATSGRNTTTGVMVDPTSGTVIS